jgi:hypothetical protein
VSRTFAAPCATLLVLLAAGFWAGCSSSETSPTPGAPSGAGAGAAAGSEVASSGAPSAGTASGVSGAVGAATAGTAGTGTATGGGAGGSSAGTAGAAVGGVAGAAAGATNGGASAGFGGSTAKGGAAGGGAPGTAGAGAAGANNCNLPATVGFQKDVQPFLTSSCGKGVGGGCHVTDTNKTSLGYDHAYDWITAFAHTGSCGGPPYMKRFEVVLAVINAANPASCPKSRIMPPPGAPVGVPLTTCQIAALQAWLAEPQVSQMHVTETDDTAKLYPPGPYLMPPFN